MRKRLNEHREFLKESFYPDEIVEKGIFKAKLQGPAPLKTSDQIPLVITNYTNLKLDIIITKINNLLQNVKNERLKEVFSNCKIISLQK